MKFLKISSLIFIIFSTLVATSGIALSDKVSPYGVRYKTTKITPILQKMDPDAPTIENLEKGTAGIVLRWCRPEFPFGKFMFGSSKERRQLLSERICEASLNGKVLFLSGKTLRPDL